MRHKRAALLTLLLLAGFVGSTALWLRAQQRQYALNRALIAALVKGDDGRALVLVNAGADPNMRYKAMPAPSLPELVKQLLHRSAPTVNESETALSIACGGIWDDEDAPHEAQQHRPDDAPLVQAMLLHSAIVNMKDEAGRSPLIWATADNRRNLARLLLEHGANVNAQFAGGVSPLMYAAMPPAYPDMVRLLLEYGAHVNAQDKDGQTALYDAMTGDQDKSTIRELLAHGADPNLADKSGITPLWWAQQIKRPDLVALLKQYGAKAPGNRH